MCQLTSLSVRGRPKSLFRHLVHNLRMQAFDVHLHARLKLMFPVRVGKLMPIY